jgi:hypothetical protein
MSSKSQRSSILLLETISIDELKNMTKEDLKKVMEQLSAVEFSNFVYMKNIKMFGGINNYIDNFFESETIKKISNLQYHSFQQDSAIHGAIVILQKMYNTGVCDATSEKISKSNRIKIEENIEILLNM